MIEHGHLQQACRCQHGILACMLHAMPAAHMQLTHACMCEQHHTMSWVLLPLQSSSRYKSCLMRQQLPLRHECSTLKCSHKKSCSFCRSFIHIHADSFHILPSLTLSSPLTPMHAGYTAGGCHHAAVQASKCTAAVLQLCDGAGAVAGHAVHAGGPFCGWVRCSS